MRLDTVKRKRTQIQIIPASLLIVGSLILSVVLPVNLSSGAPTTLGNTIRHRMEALASLQDPGGFESEKDLAPGRFLIASRKLRDPSFHKTVILILRYGRDGASGLVINRPLKIKLSTVMPEIKELEQRKEYLFLGGPVQPDRVLLLVKTPKTPEDAIPVFGDIYISSSRKELNRMIKSTNKSEKFRIYAGYAGWAPGQLESERDRGDWHVLKADAETVFDKKSSEIWQELIHRFTANWVRLKSHEDPFGKMMLNDRNLSIASKVQQVAADIERTPSQVALRWLIEQSDRGVIIPIIGARSKNQFADNLGCLDFELEARHLEEIEKVSKIELGFPHDFLEYEEVRSTIYGNTYSLIDSHRT